jgi:mitochondrial fission protein ELM1
MYIIFTNLEELFDLPERHTCRKLMKQPLSPMIWVITEGLAGTENQCLGIAEALGIGPVVKRIHLRQPWKSLSPYLGFECAYTFTEHLTGPWPDILIASGRKSIAAARYIKKQSGGKTFTIQIQDPRISPKQFDLVAVPQHDPTRGENVFVSVATPNRITPSRLMESQKNFEHLFSKLPQPRIAVLIGGTTKRHRFTAMDTQNLIAQLSPLPNLMITTSRRTGDDNTLALKAALDKNGHYFYDGISPNPYMGMLAWADIILVTADSTSMVSEAATTGKPVYVLPMKGLTPRQMQLIDNLKAYGAIRDFQGILENWTYSPLSDSANIAAEIRKKCEFL